MKYTSTLLLITVSAFTQASFAEQIDGVKINWLRTHTSKHESVPGVSSFKVDKALSSGCVELTLDAGDNLNLSHLIAAKTSGTIVDVTYKAQGPWPGGCWALAITSK